MRTPEQKAARRLNPYDREYAKAYRLANLDSRKAYEAAYKAANVARDRDRARTRYPLVAERKRATNKTWHASESGRANARAWQAAHPDNRRAQHVKRRVRERTIAVYVVTERDWRRLCARHDNRCAYCGSRAELTRDHVVPVSRGGQHSIGNLLPACRPCNSSKRHKFLIEWRTPMSMSLLTASSN